jgi:hypothetical protein
MPFWESAAQKSVRAAQAATRAALELGGIPPEARHRLEMQRKSDSRFFTSDLTCNRPPAKVSHDRLFRS